ncbi:MAG: DUF3267 domain-containing protein, partial [Saprospiraceae bacterium]
EQIFRSSFTMKFFWTLQVVLLLTMAVAAIHDVQAGLLGWGLLFRQLGAGTLLVFTVLIIVHEAIHGLAYKLVGAPEVSFGVNWRMLYFYAVAANFVVSRRRFIFVGLAPFVVVTIATIVALFVAPAQLKWVLWGVLLMHTGACAGDFALLGFYEQYRHCPEMLTFDDVENKTSWFFVREKEEAAAEAH